MSSLGLDPKPFIFSNGANSDDTLGRDIAYGVAGSAIALPLNYGIMAGTDALLRSYGVERKEPQDIVRIYEAIGVVASAFFQVILKVLLIAYIVLIGPILEEWLFRDKLYSWQESAKQANESYLDKGFRVVSNGLLFGAMHYGPSQGWTNIPIIAVTSVSGIVFASIREMTGSWRASTISHSLNNAFVMGAFMGS